MSDDTSPEALRARSDALLREGRALVKTDPARALALISESETLWELAAALERAQLRGRERSGTLGKMDAPLSRSIGQEGGDNPAARKYLHELNLRGFTLTSAARAAGISRALLSMHLSGVRRMSDSRRAALVAATGVDLPVITGK